MFIVKKSTNGEYNHGHNSMHRTNFGNSGYRGNTVVWVLHNEHFVDEGLIALYRKKDAEAMAAHFNAVGYDGLLGDPLMKFERHLINIKDWDTLDKIKQA